MPVKNSEYVTPEQIKALRSRLGLTQAEFAAALAIKLRTVTAWEGGDRNPVGPARILLQLLEQRPKLLAEVRKVAAFLVFGAAEEYGHRPDAGVRADDVREGR